MKRVLSNKIEAVLLYEEFSVLNRASWHKLINEFSAKSGISFELTENVKTPDFFHFMSDHLTVEVDYVSEPVAQGAFNNSLKSRFTKTTFPQAGNAVSSHRSYVHVVVSNGKIDPPDPFIEDEPSPQMPFTAEAFDFASSLLRWLSTVQISSGAPLAVYWAQSDKLIETREFLKLAIDHKDQSLLVHPLFFSQMNAETGQEENGLMTWGACALIGCEIKIDYVPMPSTELTAFVDHLLAITQLTGQMVPDGHVFGRSENEEIRVKHTDEGGEPVAELFVDRCDAYGIRSQGENRADELDEFDLDDPAERAMAERIKMKRQEAVEANETEADAAPDAPAEVRELSLFEQALNQPDNWGGLKKKVDMASLRNLTRSASEHVAIERPAKVTADATDDLALEEKQPDQPHAGQQQPEQRRLLKRVGGLFSRK